MTQDEIIRMAREAGFFINRDGEIESPLKEGCAIDEYIERLIGIAANHERITTIANMRPKMVQMMQDATIVEREACVNVCFHNTHRQSVTDEYATGYKDASWDCANSIRARGVNM